MNNGAKQDDPQGSTPAAAAPKKWLSFSQIDSSFDRSLAAMLSASVYTDNVWSMQTLSEPLADLPAWRAFNIPDNDPQQLVRAAALKEFYQPAKGIALPASGQAADPITGKPADWVFDHNVFYFGELACAAVVERKRLDGTSVVELCFRGTEKSTTGDAAEDRSNMLGGYFLSAYKNLEGHYERHRLLIDAVVDMVNHRQKAGEKVALHVSGHSLGGSMAELFAKKEAKRLLDPSSLFVCTFGSPGIGQSQSAFAMLVKGCVRLIKTKLGMMTDSARAASPVGKQAGLSVKVDPARVDMVQYIDPNDPVPKLGLLGGYAPTGRVYFSRSRDRDPVTGDILRGSLLDINWHSISTYEKSRQFAFTRSALRLMELQTPGKEAVAGALDKFASANKSANAFVASTTKYLDNPGFHKELEARIDQVMSQVRERSGMIPRSAPNSRADDNQLASATLKAGSMILQKLATRRSGEASSVRVETAMAAIAYMSKSRR